MRQTPPRFADARRALQSAFYVCQRMRTDVWMPALLVAHAAGRLRSTTLLHLACALALENVERKRLFVVDARVQFPQPAHDVLDPNEIRYGGQSIVAHQAVALAVMWAALGGMQYGRTPFDPAHRPNDPVADTSIKQVPKDAVFVDALVEAVGHAALYTLYDKPALTAYRNEYCMRTLLELACGIAAHLVAATSPINTGSVDGRGIGSSALSVDARDRLGAWVVSVVNAASDVLLWTETAQTRALIQTVWETVAETFCVGATATGNVPQGAYDNDVNDNDEAYEEKEGNARRLDILFGRLQRIREGLDRGARRILHIDQPSFHRAFPLLSPDTSQRE